jgi:hypothetical protein
VGIAFVEWDYVADSYIATFRDHPELELVGVHDRDERREADSASFHSLKIRPIDDGISGASLRPRIRVAIRESHKKISMVEGAHPPSS